MFAVPQAKYRTYLAGTDTRALAVVDGNVAVDERVRDTGREGTRVLEA